MDKKGVALVLILFITLFLSMVIITLANILSTDIRIVGNHLRQVKAFHIADAGIEYTISQIKKNQNWTADGSKIEFPPASGCFYIITYPKFDFPYTVVSQAQLKDGLTKTIEVMVKVTWPKVELLDWMEI